MWRWLKDRNGLTFTDRSFWSVGEPNDRASFVRALPQLLPPGSVIFIEGTAIAREAHRALRQHALESPGVVVARSTVFPPSKTFHLPATPSVISALADLFERFAAPEICDHLHVYRENTVLLAWWDASSGNDVQLSTKFGEGALRDFCARAGTSFKLIGGRINGRSE